MNFVFVGHFQKYFSIENRNLVFEASLHLNLLINKTTKRLSSKSKANTALTHVNDILCLLMYKLYFFTVLYFYTFCIFSINEKSHQINHARMSDFILWYWPVTKILTPKFPKRYFGQVYLSFSDCVNQFKHFLLI